jgi:uncharacterized protein
VHARELRRKDASLTRKGIAFKSSVVWSPRAEPVFGMRDDISLDFSHRPELSRYEALAGEHRAVAQYARKGDVYVFLHVGVPRVIQGQGIGGRLVQYALDDVRAVGGRVVPRCPFVADWIRRNPGYADLLAP